MKKRKQLLLYLLIMQMIILFSSCGKMYKSVPTKNNANSKIENSEKETKNMNIDFSVVDCKTLPQNYLSFINQLKDQSGFYYFKDGEYYYIAVFAGRKSTGGYGIKVKSVMLKDEVVNVIVEETYPDPKLKVIQVITYPYVCIKIKGDSLKFKVSNTQGKTYEYIHSVKGAAIE